MPSPFPGMDPYLEGSAWESFHAALIDDIGRQLAPKVRPKYLVRVQRRFVADAPMGLDELAIAESATYPDVGIMARTPGASPNPGGSAVGVIEPPMQLATVMTARAPQRSLSIVDLNERKLVAAVELPCRPATSGRSGGREEYIERRENFLAAAVPPESGIRSARSRHAGRRRGNAAGDALFCIREPRRKPAVCGRLADWSSRLAADNSGAAVARGCRCAAGPSGGLQPNLRFVRIRPRTGLPKIPNGSAATR